MGMSEAPEPGKIEKAAEIVKGLSLTNVLVIALLAVIAVPTYVIYRALGDDRLMDRFMSAYEEVSSQNVGCALRHVKARGGAHQWGISAGFSFVGSDRWFVNVVLDHAPSPEEIVSYCESLKLIADRMLDRGHRLDAPLVDQPGGGAEVHVGPVPGIKADGR
jgi:hypothetical protein